MTSNKSTGKTPTSEVPRVASNVPNDYEHLGVPSSLNVALPHRRRRRKQARRRGRFGFPRWVEALLAIGGVLAALGIVLLVIFLIAFPPFFRGLEPRYQQRLINMFPPFESFKPTVPFDILPTLSGGDNNDAAQQLLLTIESNTPTPTPLPQAGEITSLTAPPTPTESGGIPVGMAMTPESTPLPVYVSPTSHVAITPIWTPVVPPTEAPLPVTHRLNNVKYEDQGWNNCGPTTVTMALSYFGWRNDQYTAAKWLKPNTEDKNVSPWQMVRFVNENTGVKALYRYGGDSILLKRLLAANFPVMVEKSIHPEHDDWMGHYLLLVGYDDAQQHFLAYDSYLGYNRGEGLANPYSQFDESWRHFNRVFIVVYESSREMELRAVLGDYVDPAYGYNVAKETARADASRNQEDKWAWFNMGTAYVELYDYSNAAIAYDKAFRLSLPWRMLWYQFGPYEAFYQVGDYNTVRALATSNIAVTPYVEESYYWMGMAYAAEGNTSAAIEQFNRALRYNKNFFPAQEAKAAVESGTFTVAYTP